MSNSNKIINNISIEKFKETVGISYSKLSKLANSPQEYKGYMAEDVESSAITLGSAVDLLLTADEETFEKEIYVMSANKPSEMMTIFCEVYAETENKETAHLASGFKIDLKRVLNKFEKEGKSYYNALLQRKGRKILGIEDMFKANTIVKSILENKFTKEYFLPQNGDIELLFQVPVIWEIDYWKLPECKVKQSQIGKSIVDVIKIDHNTKEIQPIELKTGGEGFFKSFWRYKRYLQGAMYTDALTQVNKSDYTVKNIKFIYADTNMVYPPSIYTMSDKDIEIARNGVTYKQLKINNDANFYFEESKKIKIKGYKRLAAELDWHNRENLWDYNYDVYLNKGEIDINAFDTKI